MNGVLCPLEGSGFRVVDLDEVVDGVTDLVGVGAARALEGCTGQDAEPDLDLIEPTGTGGMKWKCTFLCFWSHRSCLGLWVLKLPRVTWRSTSEG